MGYLVKEQHLRLHENNICQIISVDKNRKDTMYSNLHINKSTATMECMLSLTVPNPQWCSARPLMGWVKMFDECHFICTLNACFVYFENEKAHLTAKNTNYFVSTSSLYY